MAAKRGTQRKSAGRTVIIGAAPRVPRETKASRVAFTRADQKIADFKERVSKK